MSEANITVNGTPLNSAQSMAVRIALTAFHSDMTQPDALGSDEHGKKMANLYRERLAEVLKLIF